jgi:hypothetical protein
VFRLPINLTAYLKIRSLSHELGLVVSHAFPEAKGAGYLGANWTYDNFSRRKIVDKNVIKKE